MDQNGLAYTVQNLDSEDGGYLNNCGNRSQKKELLQNGHRKHPKKPQNSVDDLEKLERFLEDQNGSIAEDHFDVDHDYHSGDGRSMSADSLGRSESSLRGGSRHRKHPRWNGLDSHSGLSMPNSYASSIGGSEGGPKLTNGVGRGHGSISDEDDISSLSDGISPDESGLLPSSGLDMTRYIERTPRRDSPSSEQPPASLKGEEDCYQSTEECSLQSNTNGNNNKNPQRNITGSAGATGASYTVPPENLVSLSKEEPPSYLEKAYDSRDATDDDESDEFGETVIPAGLQEAIHAAAQNFEEFIDDSENAQVVDRSSFGSGRIKQGGERKQSGESHGGSYRNSRGSSIAEEYRGSDGNVTDNKGKQSGRSLTRSLHSSGDSLIAEGYRGQDGNVSASHGQTSKDRSAEYPKCSQLDGRSHSIESDSGDKSHDRTGVLSQRRMSEDRTRMSHRKSSSNESSVEGDRDSVSSRRSRSSPASRATSRRSSRHSLADSKQSSASEDVEAPGELPYKKTYKGSIDDPLRNYSSEAAAFQERRSTKIPELKLQRLTDTEPESETPRSKEELSSRLSEERHTRRQAAEVNHELQREYDKLLAKYAHAENTIDQLRLGARVNLLSDPSAKGRRRKHSRDRGSSRNVSEAANQTENQDMRNTVANLSQQILLLERAISTSQVPPEDQQALFDKLKQSHGRLEQDYLQRRDESQVQQRWDSVLLDSAEDGFDPDNSLEGKIYNVGMQLEDLQEKVEENQRSNPPFTPSRHSTSRQQRNNEDIPVRMRDTARVTPEYNQLLQKYEVLKQLPETPRRDKEIQRLVKDLDDLQMAPPEEHHQQRWDMPDAPPAPRQMASRGQSPSPSSGRGSRSPTLLVGGRGDHSPDDDSSGRGTPSSAKSLESRKITRERKSRIPKKTASRSLPLLDTKTREQAGESGGSSHPRSPEYEDSGFVGSEGSRQSQQSKNITQTIPLPSRVRGETALRSGKKASSHTPIQELSERGQSSNSESRRRSRTPRKAVVATTSEDEDYADPVERPVRLSRKPPAPSRSPRDLIASPLPSKPRVQDFQRKSPPERDTNQKSSNRSSPKASPEDKEGNGLRSAFLAPDRNGVAGSLGRPVSNKSGSHSSKLRRGSDVPSSATSKRSSAKSEEMRALREQIAGLKQQIQSPQTLTVRHPQRRERGSKSMSVESGHETDSTSGDQERASDVSKYRGDGRGSLKEGSIRGRGSSVKSERFEELKAEMDRLKEDVKAAMNDRGRGRQSGVAKDAPSATSTPHHPRNQQRQGYGSGTRARSLDRLGPNEGREAWSTGHHQCGEGPVTDGRHRRRAPSLDRRAPRQESRDNLRENLKRDYIPTTNPRQRDTIPGDLMYDDEKYPSREFGRMDVERMLRTPVRGNLSPSPQGDYSKSHGYPKYEPLSSMDHQVYHGVSMSPQQGSLPCNHCNGSGVHTHQMHHGHHHIGSNTQQPPPAQTGHTQTSPNGTVFVPQGSPNYHSTPAVVHKHSSPVQVLQGSLQAQGSPLVHQVPSGTVVQTVETSPQQSFLHTDQPVTVLAPGTHRIYVPSPHVAQPQTSAVQPQTVLVQPEMVTVTRSPEQKVTIQPQMVTVPPQTVQLQPQMIRIPAQTVSVQPQVVTVPGQTVAVQPQTVQPQPATMSPPRDRSGADDGTQESGARPVYLVPSTKGRYYISDEPRQTQSDMEEIVYRRTPGKKSPRRTSPKADWHSEMEVEDMELDDSLYEARRMAQRLKRSSERVLDSVQSNLKRSGRRVDFH